MNVADQSLPTTEKREQAIPTLTGTLPLKIKLSLTATSCIICDVLFKSDMNLTAPLSEI